MYLGNAIFKELTMETQLHLGDARDTRQLIWNLQADIARLHLIHDFGDFGARHLFSTMNPSKLIKDVLAQRAQMLLDGTLLGTNEEGKTVLTGKLDLEKLGVSEEDSIYLAQNKLHAAPSIDNQTGSGPTAQLGDAISANYPVTVPPAELLTQSERREIEDEIGASNQAPSVVKPVTSRGIAPTAAPASTSLNPEDVAASRTGVTRST